MSEDQATTAHLGSRLKEARLRSGLSLREFARRLEVSPSFISQLENGKSQPSVATLLSMTQILGISMDSLFPGSPESAPSAAPPPARRPSVPEPSRPSGQPISRSDIEDPTDVWDATGAIRFMIIDPSERARLEMDSGVVWEQLAPSVDHSVDFIEVVYPVGSSSTNDGRMLQHRGLEYALLLQGEVTITYGFEQYIMRAGQSLTLDPSIPHLLTNTGTVEARGIWCLIHP